jgi:hypothetical protein
MPYINQPFNKTKCVICTDSFVVLHETTMYYQYLIEVDGNIL